MAAYSALYQQLRVQAKWVPDPTLDAAITWALRNFCSNSRLLREVLTIDSVAYQEDYTLTSTQTGHEVFGVKAASWNNEPLDPSQVEEEKREFGTPQLYFFKPPNVITLQPAPDSSEDDILVVNCYIQPTTSGTQVHDQIMSKFDRTIVDGALSWLLNLKDEPCYDPRRALQKDSDFRLGVARARNQGDMGHRTRAFRTLPVR